MDNARFRWIAVLTAIFLLATIVIIGLIAGGVFDPAPFGLSIWQENLSTTSVDAHSEKIIWLDKEVPKPPYTIRLNAAHDSGEDDIAYGLVLGDDNAYFSISVSPLGYLAIWDKSTKKTYYLHWQPWPHVRTGNEQNEIWLDIDGNNARVRVNREFLWQGTINHSGESIGILGKSFGRKSVIDFEAVELFALTDEKSK